MICMELVKAWAAYNPPPQKVEDWASKVYQCIGDRCAHWRFSAYDTRAGYCGLSGVPQDGTEEYNLIHNPASAEG